MRLVRDRAWLRSLQPSGMLFRDSSVAIGQRGVASLSLPASAVVDLAPRSARPNAAGVTGVDFEDFVAATSTRLFTLAMLLAGRSQADAEDLLQDVLERAYRHWPRIVRGGEPEPYIRRMLANAAVDRRRQLRLRPETPLDPDAPAATNEIDQVTERAVLMRALADLPPRQRAVLVLRYFEDLTEAQTAAALGCRVGTIKSQSSRALARIRKSAGLPDGAGAMPKGAVGDG